MKNYIIILFAIFLAMFSQSCLKDDSNYDISEVVLPDSVFIHHDGERIDMSTIKNFNVVYNQEVNFELEVKYNGDDNLKYVWYIGEKPVFFDKNFKWKCDVTGIVQCALEIKREKAGNSTIYPFNFMTRVPYAMGFSILAEKEGRNVMDFIEKFTRLEKTELGTAYTTDFVFYDDVYKQQNGEDLPAGEYVKTIKYRPRNQSSLIHPYYYGTYLLLNKTAGNSLNLNGTTCKKEVMLNEEFAEGIPSGTVFKDALYLGYSTYLTTEEGKLYSRTNYSDVPYGGYYFNLPVKYEGQEINVSKITGSAKYDNKIGVLFDKNTNHYFAIAAASSKASENGKLIKIEAATGSYPTGFTPFNAMDKEVVELFAYKYCHYAGKTEFFALLKDATNKYYVQKFYVEVTSKNILKKVLAKSEKIFSGTDLVSSTSKFTMCNKYSGSEMMFTTENKLYHYNLSTNATPIMVKEFEGKNITHISVSQDVWNTANELYSLTTGKYVTLAFDNGDLEVYKWESNFDSEEPIIKQVYKKNYSKIYSIDYYSNY